jgi:hypothetical protein
MILFVILFAVLLVVMLGLAVLRSAARPIPPVQFSIPAWRQPGESDDDLVNRMLNQSPTHQAELRRDK